MPTAIFKSLIRHFWFRTTYFALTEPVPAKIRQQMGRRDAVLRDRAKPPHLVRWLAMTACWCRAPTLKRFRCSYAQRSSCSEPVS